MNKHYEPTAQGMKQFLEDLSSPSFMGALPFESRLTVPVIVCSESGEREGVVRTHWHLFPDGAPVYMLEIDPEHERQLLAFRCHIQLPETLFLDELLSALNEVNFLMEPAHFTLDNHTNPPTLRFYYAIPTDDATFSFEQLKRMTIETMLWVSCLTPELIQAAQGRLDPAAFHQWLHEHHDRLFTGAAEERLRWWLETCGDRLI